MTVLGPIISDDQVEEAVLATLRNWVPLYLAEVERNVGLDPGFYDRPADSSYTARTDFDKWPEEWLPLVMAITPGIEDDPPKDGYGHLRARFGIGVVCVVSSVDRLETRRYAYRLGAAVRAALVQHASLDLALGGTVRGVDLVGGRNNELPTEDDRTIWASRQLFVVEVGNFLSTNGPGITVPPADPLEPLPEPPTIQNPNVLLNHQ